MSLNHIFLVIGCAYYAAGPRTTVSVDSTTIRERAASLLGCGDSSSNKINGLEVSDGDGSGVCLSSGSGCGDCFDGELHVRSLIKGK